MSSVWIPVRVNLEDRTTAINGKLQYENNSDHGVIKFKTSDAGINCSGKWKISTGSSSNNETVKGVWEVSCSDGRTVTGQYESNEKEVVVVWGMIIVVGK